jgi:hypothetical protein
MADEGGIAGENDYGCSGRRCVWKQEEMTVQNTEGRAQQREQHRTRQQQRETCGPLCLLARVAARPPGHAGCYGVQP